MQRLSSLRADAGDVVSLPGQVLRPSFLLPRVSTPFPYFKSSLPMSLLILYRTEFSMKVPLGAPWGSLFPLLLLSFRFALNRPPGENFYAAFMFLIFFRDISFCTFAVLRPPRVVRPLFPLSFSGRADLLSPFLVCFLVIGAHFLFELNPFPVPFFCDPPQAPPAFFLCRIFQGLLIRNARLFYLLFILLVRTPFPGKGFPSILIFLQKRM